MQKILLNQFLTSTTAEISMDGITLAGICLLVKTPKLLCSLFGRYNEGMIFKWNRAEKLHKTRRHSWYFPLMKQGVADRIWIWQKIWLAKIQNFIWNIRCSCLSGMLLLKYILHIWSPVHRHVAKWVVIIYSGPMGGFFSWKLHSLTYKFGEQTFSKSKLNRKRVLYGCHFNVLKPETCLKRTLSRKYQL